jgi:hypothetical protein
MNLSPSIAKNYDNKSGLLPMEKQSQTKPIQSQNKPKQSQTCPPAKKIDAPASPKYNASTI